MDVIVSRWLLVGFILYVVGAIAKLAQVVKQRTKHRINPEPWQNYQTNLIATSIRQDNVKLVTRGEAMNRRITGGSQFMIEYVDSGGVITER